MKRFGLTGLILMGLLFAAQIVSAEGWPGCPWGRTYDAMANGYVGDCFAEPAALTQTAAKPAGLAAPAPVVAPAPNSGCLSYAGPAYSVCVVASSGSSAAAKPAGLAAPASAPTRDSPCGAQKTPIYAAGYVSCVNADQTTLAAAKPAGLAAPAQERFVPCGFGERLDPLALACQR